MSTLFARLVGQAGPIALDVELTATTGGLLLAGENGAGKTSVLRFILGARRAERARVVVGERTLVDTAAGIEVPIEARRLGYVPQHQALFPHLTALENVRFGARARPRPDRDPRAHAVAMLAALDATRLAERRPDQLSGGERQRVALARALAAEPDALLLDEPFAALDARARAETRDVLAATLSRARVPFILVAHDLRDAEGLAETIAVLERGTIVASGRLEDLRASPLVTQLLTR